MATKVIMPKQGLQMTEGTIISWLAKEGEKVVKDEPLFEMETDKLTITIDAPTSGTLLKILRGEGETVPITEEIAIIGEPGEDISKVLTGSVITDKTDALQKEIKISAPEISLQTDKPYVGRIFASPRAKMLADEKGINLKKVSASGPDGLIIEKDILECASKASAQSEAAELPKATPIAARIAEINDISLTDVKGSGERGKITKVDVEARIEAGKRTSEKSQRGERLVPFTGIRKIIADKMTKSLREMAQANHRMRVDVSEITRLRNNLKAADIKVSFSDIFVKVVAKALTEYPGINASYTEEGIIVKGYVNIGLAVATTNGLIVPVIKDADMMTLQEIASTSSELVGKARSGKLLPDDYTGGTFTITNLGMFDIDEFTAIINPPESAILGIGKISNEPVVEGDSIVIRPIMTLSLTYDHRVIDGAPAAQFLQRVKQIMQTPYLLL